jgi:SOS-response transcriptional repressor LexA
MMKQPASLTPRQQEALGKVRGLLASMAPLSPSLDEIGAALGARSRSSAARLVSTLIIRGHLTHLPFRRRSLMLTSGAASVPVPPTARQLDALRIIAEWLDRYQVAPSVRELQAEMDLGSTSGVVRLLVGLQDRGWISRDPMAARGIVLLHRPAMAPEGPVELTTAGELQARQLAEGLAQ